MTRIFIELPFFRSQWRSLGLNDNDLLRLQSEILLNPKIGSVMKDTGGVRKMRFAFDQRGKSGSIRVIYVDFEIYEQIILLTAYTKSTKDNLNKEESNELHQMVNILKKQMDEKNKKGE